MEALRHVFTNGTLRMAVKIAIPIFLLGTAWAKLWAKVSSLEVRMEEGFDRLYGLVECLMKQQ